MQQDAQANTSMLENNIHYSFVQLQGCIFDLVQAVSRAFREYKTLNVYLTTAQPVGLSYQAIQSELAMRN